jgi:hypothetical protein
MKFGPSFRTDPANFTGRQSGAIAHDLQDLIWANPDISADIGGEFRRDD